MHHKLNESYYFEILEREGLGKALSQLQTDMERLQFATFESAEGYQPHIYEELRKYRSFSEQLWRKRQEKNIKP